MDCINYNNYNFSILQTSEIAMNIRCAHLENHRFSRYTCFALSKSETAPAKVRKTFGFFVIFAIIIITISPFFELPKLQQTFAVHISKITDFLDIKQNLFCLLRTIKKRNRSGKSPKNLRFSGLAGAFSYTPVNYIMQAFIVGWNVCSLLPSRTLYHTGSGGTIFFDRLTSSCYTAYRKTRRMLVT